MMRLRNLVYRRRLPGLARLAIPGICLCALVLVTPATAEFDVSERQVTPDFKIVTVDINRTGFHLAAELRPELEHIGEALQRGLVALDQLFENPGLPEKPDFWIVKNDTQLAALLKERYPQMQAAELKAALQVSAYVKGPNFFVIYRSRIARARLLRLIFNEYAGLHLNVLTPGGQKKRIGWFHTGMAAYLGWFTEGQVSGRSPAATEALMLESYARHFDPAAARQLSKLERPADWSAAIRADHKAVYAQAALTWAYLARRAGPASGPLILRIMRTPERFSDAFERATGLRLGEFEKDLREKFYPEISALKAAASAPSE